MPATPVLIVHIFKEKNKSTARGGEEKSETASVETM